MRNAHLAEDPTPTSKAAVMSRYGHVKSLPDVMPKDAGLVGFAPEWTMKMFITLESVRVPDDHQGRQ